MSKATMYTVPQDDPNLPPQLRGIKQYFNADGVKLFEHKTYQIFHEPDGGGPIESQSYVWVLNQEQGVYDPVITKRLPSREPIAVTSPGLNWINNQFAAKNQDMPPWIYEDMTPAMQARWKMYNLFMRYGEEVVDPMREQLEVSGADL